MKAGSTHLDGELQQGVHDALTQEVGLQAQVPAARAEGEVGFVCWLVGCSRQAGNSG
jgi:hypothetical protein